jgi:hypothetical protein
MKNQLHPISTSLFLPGREILHLIIIYNIFFSFLKLFLILSYQNNLKIYKKLILNNFFLYRKTPLPDSTLNRQLLLTRKLMIKLSSNHHGIGRASLKGRWSPESENKLITRMVGIRREKEL